MQKVKSASPPEENIVHVVVNQCFNKLVILRNSRGFFFFFFYTLHKKRFFYISFPDQCFYYRGQKNYKQHSSLIVHYPVCSPGFCVSYYGVAFFWDL